jgi:hypothetical protein
MSAVMAEIHAVPEAIREATAFTVGMRLNGLHLPVRHARDSCGVILDTEDNLVAVIDVNRERPDDQVMAIAELVVVAINSYAGLTAEVA